MGIEMDAMKTLAVIFASALAAGCAAHPDPIIDMKGVDLDQYDEDWAECESYTEEVLVAKGVTKGAGLGAVVGAATGAIGGNSTDMAEGAGVGALYGGTRSGLDADEMKQTVFKRCMRGRGYRVLN
jgi:outer membrane lipoprotein SlyB